MRSTAHRKETAVENATTIMTFFLLLLPDIIIVFIDYHDLFHLPPPTSVFKK